MKMKKSTIFLAAMTLLTLACTSCGDPTKKKYTFTCAADYAYTLVGKTQKQAETILTNAGFVYDKQVKGYLLDTTDYTLGVVFSVNKDSIAEAVSAYKVYYTNGQEAAADLVRSGNRVHKEHKNPFLETGYAYAYSRRTEEEFFYMQGEYAATAQALLEEQYKQGWYDKEEYDMMKAAFTYQAQDWYDFFTTKVTTSIECEGEASIMTYTDQTNNIGNVAFINFYAENDEGETAYEETVMVGINQEIMLEEGDIFAPAKSPRKLRHNN